MIVDMYGINIDKSTLRPDEAILQNSTTLQQNTEKYQDTTREEVQSERSRQAAALNTNDKIKDMSNNKTPTLPVYKSETWNTKIQESKLDLLNSRYPIGDERQFKITLPKRQNNRFRIQHG